jgi:hypothetical protein
VSGRDGRGLIDGRFLFSLGGGLISFVVGECGLSLILTDGMLFSFSVHTLSVLSVSYS